MNKDNTTISHLDKFIIIDFTIAKQLILKVLRRYKKYNEKDKF
jgi:hypothetical protein